MKLCKLFYSHEFLCIILVWQSSNLLITNFSLSGKQGSKVWIGAQGGKIRKCTDVLPTRWSKTQDSKYWSVGDHLWEMLWFVVTVWVWWLCTVLFLIPKSSPSLWWFGFGSLWRVAKAKGENQIFLSMMGSLQDVPHSTEHMQLLLGPCNYCWVMVPRKKLKIAANPRVYAEWLLQTQEMCTEIGFVWTSRHMLCSHTSHDSTRSTICPDQQLEVCS